LTELRDHHATIFLPPEVAAPLEIARRQWDPDMAAMIPAHVTVVYPNEAPSADVLADWVSATVARITPFRLRLGPRACFGRPEDGIYVDVDDIDGGYGDLREAMLGAERRHVPYTPHVTILHPRTSRHGRALWDSGWTAPPAREFTVREVAITAFDGVRWPAVMTFPLSDEGEIR
jgi:2'-5' RNA ligase